MEDITKHYSNGEITIVWKPKMCIHSKKCWQGETGLLAVFNPMEKPWIKPNGATTQRIIEQIRQCPSGALSYFQNELTPESTTETSSTQIVEVLPNGPLLVYGNISVKDKSGEFTTKNNVTAFCRCGVSENKPYCDGSHVKCGFKD